MNAELKLANVITRKIADSQKRNYVTAFLGDGNGNVSTGTPGMVYARTELWGQVVEVYNGRVPLENDRPILIGTDEAEPGLVQVLSSRGTFEAKVTADVGPHGTEHAYDGNDVAWIYKEQFLPLLVLPYDTFEVIIYGSMIYVAGAWVKVLNQYLDLAAYQPVSGAIWALLQVDTSGLVSVVSGSSYGSAASLTASNLPTPSANNMPICAIKLYSTQTEIQRDINGTDDFLDLRFAGYATNIPSSVTDTIFHPFLLMGA